MSGDQYGRVRELAKQLQPFLGERADKLVKAWLAEDSDGRREILQVLELAHSTYLKADTPAALLAPPPASGQLSDVGIAVGNIHSPTGARWPLRLSPSQLNRHVLIAGASGSGKTTLIYHFAKGLLEQDIPFFLYDFNLDYRPLTRLSNRVRVYTVGEELAPLPFNPLAELIQLCQTRSGLKDLNPLFQLADVMCKTFYVGHGVKSILCGALAQAARVWAQQSFASEHTPSFRTLLAWVREHDPPEMKGMRFKEWKVSTIRALEQLSTGSFGTSLAVPRDKHVGITALKQECAIFELNLPEDLKRFFVESMLLCMRQHALQEVKQSGKGKLRNVMILDEAHNLLKKTEEHVESQLSIALREHRGLGTGYIIADQVPSQLDDSAIANTHTKFFFTLDNARDIRTAAQSLLLTPEQQDLLGKLPVGNCLVRFGTLDAFLLKVEPLDDLKNRPLSDNELRPRAADSSHSAPETPPPAEPAANQPPPSEGMNLLEAERKILLSILDEPFAGISRHFRRVGLSTRKGQLARVNLEQRGLIRCHEVARPHEGGGRVVILELTRAGVDMLNQLGRQAEYPYYRGSPEHEYWKEAAANHLRRQGYSVTKERRLAGGGAVDLEAVRQDERLAVEVETGASDPLGNIRKALGEGYDRVVSLATRPSVAVDTLKTMANAGLEDERVAVATPASLQPDLRELVSRFCRLPAAARLHLMELAQGTVADTSETLPIRQLEEAGWLDGGNLTSMGETVLGALGFRTD